MPLNDLYRPCRQALSGPLAAVACAMLTACAHTPSPEGSADPHAVPAAQTDSPSTAATDALPTSATGQWGGRLSLKLAPWQGQSASGITLAFDLRSQAEGGTLDLSTALGTQVARLTWQQQGAQLVSELETSEGRRQFGSLEELSQSVLGEALPLQALPHWLSGQPAPQWPHSPGPQAGQFTQQGWQVDASELPRGRLNLDRAANVAQRGVTLRVRLDL